MTNTRYCPFGHIVEPTWDHCPYCARGQRPIDRPIPKTARKIEIPNPVEDPGNKQVKVTQFIEVPGECSAVPVLAWLVALSGVHKGTDFSIMNGRVLVGHRMEDDRGTKCDIILQDKGISTPHATIQYYKEKQSWVIIDERSMNGTFLNSDDDRLNPHTPHELVDNDLVRLGDVKVIFKCLPHFAMEEFGEPAVS